MAENVLDIARNYRDFDVRLMGDHFAANVEIPSIKPWKDNSSVRALLRGNHALEMMLTSEVNSDRPSDWRLDIRDHENFPRRSLASISKSIGMPPPIGLIGINPGRLNYWIDKELDLADPRTARVLLEVASFTEMNRQRRNMEAILSGWPDIEDPTHNRFVRLIENFSDPTTLLAGSNYDDSTRLVKFSGSLSNMPGSFIAFQLHWLRKDDFYCYINWKRDTGEGEVDLHSSEFKLGPEGKIIDASNQNFPAGTTRGRLREEMLAFLNASESSLKPTSLS